MLVLFVDCAVMWPCADQIVDLGLSPFVATEIAVESGTQYEVSLNHYTKSSKCYSDPWRLVTPGIKVCSPSMTVCPGRMNKQYQTDRSANCIFSVTGSEEKAWTELSQTFVATGSTITLYLAMMNGYTWYADAITFRPTGTTGSSVQSARHNERLVCPISREIMNPRIYEITR